MVNRVVSFLRAKYLARQQQQQVISYDDFDLKLVLARKLSTEGSGIEGWMQ
jgi:hypothetical protein